MSYMIGDSVKVMQARSDKIRNKNGEVVSPIKGSDLLVVEVVGEGDWILHPRNLRRTAADTEAKSKAELHRRLRKFEIVEENKG